MTLKTRSRSFGQTVPERLMLVRFALLITVISVTTSGFGVDWPEFRGPTGQGVASVRDLPVTWSESENVAWKVEVPGLGWSSPAVVSGRVFVTTAVPQDAQTQSLRVLCLDAATGKKIWDQELFQQIGPVEIHKKNSHASSSPLVVGDRVFVHFGPHGTASLDFSGNIIWKTNRLKYLPRHGTGGSPALAGDRLIICCDGHDQQFVAAVSTKTGELLWRKDRGLSPAKGFSFGTPLVITLGDKSQAICPGSDAVMAFDPDSGDEIWRLRYDGYSVVPRPIFAGGLVVISTGYDEPKVLGIDPTGAGDVTESHLKWTVSRGAPNNPSPVAVGTDLYMVSDDGILSCVELATGKQRWQKRLGGAYSASLLFADGRVYVQDEEGKGTVVKPGPRFESLAENTIAPGERTFASYAAIDGALFIRSESHLYRIGGAATVASSSK
jgi:outer membrane protein assembly factor BamB